MIDDEVLTREWIVACVGTDVQDKPLQLSILGERVVLFRTDDGIHAFRDICIHRGAALSLGCVRDNRLICPYHAWEYDGDGTCVKIPQLPDGQPIPTKARAVPYECREAYGFVWVKLSESPAPFLHLPDHTNADFHHVLWGPTAVEAKPPRIIENFLDVGHLAFVHEGYLGVPSHAEIGDYRVANGADGVLRTDEIAIFQPDPDGSGKPRHVYYTYEILSPLSVRFVKRDPLTSHRMTILLTVRPDGEDMSTVFGIISFDYETGMSDKQITDFQDMIFRQDKPIVEHQKPEELPLDLQAELSLKCDRVSIAYRQYLRSIGVTFGTA